MSEVTEERETAEAGSLNARMRSRREQLESRTTVVLPVPGFEQILAFELRALGWATIRRITGRHRKRDEAEQELYGAADVLLTAREATYWLHPENPSCEVEIAGEAVSARPLDDAVKDLARRAGHTVTPEHTERQAFLMLIPDTRIMGLYREWEEWLQGQDLDEELAADFGRTP